MTRVRRLLPALLLLAGCGTCGGGTPPPSHPFFAGRPHPLVFAHRGGAGVLPEETLPALLGAHARNPAWVVELDVHRAADGALVVLHDATVDRTTDGSGRVDALTLAQLKALDAGYCATPGVGRGTAPKDACRAPGARAEDFPFRGKGYRIATLGEVLAALPQEAALSVEVKAGGFEAQVAEALRAWGGLDRLVVGAGDGDVSARLKALLPEAAHYVPASSAACLTLTAKTGLPFPRCERSDVLAIPLGMAGLRLDTPEVLAAARRRGIRTVYWTVNAEEDLARVFRLGADGVFTDYPDRAQAVLDRLRAEGAVP